MARIRRVATVETTYERTFEAGELVRDTNETFYVPILTKTNPYENPIEDITSVSLVRKGGTGLDSLTGILRDNNSTNKLQDIIVGDIVESVSDGVLSNPASVIINDVIFISGLNYFIVPTTFDLNTISIGDFISSSDIPALTLPDKLVIDRIDYQERQVFIADLQGNFININVTKVNGVVEVYPKVRVSQKVNNNEVILSGNLTTLPTSNPVNVTIRRGITELPVCVYRFTILDLNRINTLNVNISISNPNSNNALVKSKNLNDYKNLAYTNVNTSSVNVSNILNTVGIPFNPSV